MSWRDLPPEEMERIRALVDAAPPLTPAQRERIAAIVAARQPPPPAIPRADNEPRRLLPIAEAARQLGIGRTKLYGLLGTGEIASVRIGTKRRLIPSDELDRYIASLKRETDLWSRGGHEPYSG